MKTKEKMPVYQHIFNDVLGRTGNVDDAIRALCDSGCSAQEAAEILQGVGYQAEVVYFFQVRSVKFGTTTIGWIPKSNFYTEAPNPKESPSPSWWGLEVPYFN